MAIAVGILPPSFRAEWKDQLEGKPAVAPSEQGSSITPA